MKPADAAAGGGGKMVAGATRATTLGGPIPAQGGGWRTSARRCWTSSCRGKQSAKRTASESESESESEASEEPPAEERRGGSGAREGRI